MAALLLSIALHVVLGVALACAVWAVGAGLLTAVARRGYSPSRLVLAYPLGLLALTVASFAYLASPIVGAIAALGLGACLVPLVRSRTGRFPFGALRPVAWASPFVLGLPFALGLLLHGPTAEVPSSAYGDYVFWATRSVSAARSIVPFEDLLVADRKASYIEGSPTLLGGFLTHLPGFDAFLFVTSSLPALMLASLCLGLALLASERIRPPVAPPRAAALAALAVGSVAYPTWLTESAPVPLALPLVLSLYLIWRDRLPLAGLFALSGVLAVDLYFTKGVCLIVLAVVVAVSLARDHHEALASRAKLVAGAVAGLAFVAVLWRLRLLSGPTTTLPPIRWTFVPANAARGIWEQFTTRSTHELGPTFEVGGQVLLAFALLRTRSYALLAALAVGVAASWLMLVYGFDFVVGASVFLAVLRFWDRPELLERVRPTLVAAGVSLAGAAWFRDSSGARSGLVLVLLFGGAFLATFLSQTGRPPSRAALYGSTAIGTAGVLALVGRPVLGALVLGALAVFARHRLATATVAGALAVGVTAATVGAARGSLHLSDQRVTLTTDHYRIWHRVADMVPGDGLVFTSMTGEVIDGDHGWNYYPGVAGRQLYIGGWLDGPLAEEPEERATRLRLNRGVLEGSIAPSSLAPARKFKSYYAVVHRRERTPRTFRRIYANDEFALYRIEQSPIQTAR